MCSVARCVLHEDMNVTERRDRSKSPRPTGSKERYYRACGCAHRFVPGEQTSPGRS
jgi:hypothetical protein